MLNIIPSTFRILTHLDVSNITIPTFQKGTKAEKKQLT